MFFDKLLDAFKLENLNSSINHINRKLSKLDQLPEESQNSSIESENFPSHNLLNNRQAESNTDIVNIIKPSNTMPPVIAQQTESLTNSAIQKNSEDTTQKITSLQDEPIIEQSYESDKILIPGLHIQFIGVIREIIDQNKYVPIALMRKYHLSKADLSQIISEAQSIHLLDKNNNVLVTKEFYEHFIDQYDPTIFTCTHSVFDKDLYMCIGEIAIEDGAESLYDEFDYDDMLDYLEILEKANVLKYSNATNTYKALVSVATFREMCNYIPTIQKATIPTHSIKELDSMNGYNFEIACVHILRKNGFSNVKITPKCKDHGVDIFADKNDISYAIQCKRYSSNVGNAAVQQAHTGKSLYRKDIAVVLTNQFFTEQAKGEAVALGVKLWNRDKLQELINNSQ